METLTYAELPDTITPEDYMKWRRCGLNYARNKFNSKGFPRIEDMGKRRIADKRKVLLFELGLTEEDRREVLKQIAKEII